jgi:hypothetical protein
MTEGHPTPSDRADEAVWTSIPDDDEVWAGPTRYPPPLADPAPPLLNTHEMDWESFERLVLAMAHRLDGAWDVRRYGRSGQAQHGLDVVAFFAQQRAPSVYQAKRWQDFNATDLEQAVERYTGGRRPFGADRIVVAVASEVRDATTLEMLAELRGEHPDMQIELWDKQRISDSLRDEPHLVTTFFGAATAAVFCAPTPNPDIPAPTPSIAADAVLRGPIAHLGLGDDLRRAEDALRERPAEAAGLLAEIAGRLEDSAFAPHAAPLRELEARALRAADRRADEAWVRIDLGWHHLHAGDTFSASVQVRAIAEGGDANPEDVVRCTNALSVAIGVRREYAVTLEQLAEAVDALTNGDAHRVDAALALAEEAVATRHPGLVEVRAGLLRDLAAAVPKSREGQVIAARLRMCLADCCDGWGELAATARDAYPPAVTSLVLARHARHLALIPQPEPSVARWRDAIERACVERLNDDAADWLYSLRGVRVQHGLITNDINDPHRHAQALRAAGSGTVLPEPYRARERALAMLQEQKWPDALEALRRYLWRSVVGADWSGEMDAHELLGDLLVRTGRGPDAIRHYAIAGQSKKLEELAVALRDQPVRLPLELITPRPWERAAAFTFAAACADLIVHEDARQWCTAAFREVVDHPKPAASLAPDPWLAAFNAFGNLADVSTEEQARQFLEISRKLIGREPNTYRHTDEAQVNALICIARAHPDLRAEAIDQLLASLLIDQRMAELALSKGQDLLHADPTRTLAAIGEAAAAGNYYAALALVATGGDTRQAVEVARQQLEVAVAPRAHEPGVRTFGTVLVQTALFATILPEEERARFARGMLEFANDGEEPGHNRYDALTALQVIARHVSDDVRDELFEQVLPFAEGRHEPGPGDELFPGAGDVLQRFRLSFEAAPLAPAAVMAAAALAHTREQYAVVEPIAVAQLRDASDQTANSIAVALASVPADELTLPVQLLASHPSQWLRALAAVIWSQRPDQPVEIGLDLARDPSRHVRTSMARSLLDNPRHAEVRAVLTEDPRRSVRRKASGTSNG